MSLTPDEVALLDLCRSTSDPDHTLVRGEVIAAVERILSEREAGK